MSPYKLVKPAQAFGLFPLILTVLNEEHSRGVTIMRTKDCEYKGEHPKLSCLHPSSTPTVRIFRRPDASKPSDLFPSSYAKIKNPPITFKHKNTAPKARTHSRPV